MTFLSSSSTTSSTITVTMATDVSFSHTIDDDITFERVRHMPRRTQFVSNHRKLSWQYDKEMKQHERDRRISHVEMSRAKTAMAEKLKCLQDVKKQMERKRSDQGERVDRRFSAPCLPDTIPGDQKETSNVAAATAMKHSHSVPSLPPEVPTIPEDSEVRAKQGGRVRTVVVAKAPDAFSARTAGRRATIAEGASQKSGLPPHLLRRLSQFMESTSSLLLASPSSRHQKESEGKKHGQGDHQINQNQRGSQIQGQSSHESESRPEEL